MRFDQVKMAANDPEALAAFYVEALGCEILLPPTVVDEVASRGVGAPGATLELTILGLPGYEGRPPLLELYRFVDGRLDDWPYRPGQGQMAIQVDDVYETVTAVLTAGGSMQGEIVDWAHSGRTARFVYMRDPEDNIIDLWSPVEESPPP